MAFFQPNCTLPPAAVTYVANPNVRSTLDILWSSLATIIACTYTILHLNLPEQRRGRDPGWKGNLKWTVRRLRRNLAHCLVAVLVPEWNVWKSTTDWRYARRQLRTLHDRCPHTRSTVSIVHMLFANMGGFTIEYFPEDRAPGSRRDLYESDGPAHSPPMAPTGADGNEQNLSTLGDPLQDDLAFPESSHNQTARRHAPESEQVLWHLSPRTLRKLISDDYISSDLPSVEQIMDKSKADAPAKIIAMLQIFYFVLTVLARLKEEVSICALELGTAAFVLCSTPTYVATWRTPKSPETSVVLLRNASPDTMRHVKKVAKQAPAANTRQARWIDYSVPPSDFADRTASNLELIVLVLVVLSFNSVHVAGWNLSFPTTVDVWLWRCSALAALVVPAITFLVVAYEDGTNGFRLVTLMILVACLLLYVTARLLLIVEMFRELAYLTPDHFAATWTANIPHIG